MTKPAEIVVEDGDYGYAAQQVAEAHRQRCEAWMEFCEEHGYDDEPEFEQYKPDFPDPSSAPYDGCQTCMVREVLHADWPVIDAYAGAEVRAALQTMGARLS